MVCVGYRVRPCFVECDNAFYMLQVTQPPEFRPLGNRGNFSRFFGAALLEWAAFTCLRAAQYNRS